MEENRLKYGKLACIAGICCNVCLAGAKLVVGVLSGMVSVIADGINNLSDALASIITLMGFRLSERPADDDHPFGHARFEYISGLAVAFIVMLAGVELLKGSIEKVISPSEIDFSKVMFAVLVLSILVKLGMAVFYTMVGRRIGSTSLEAAAQDSRNDVIATSAVLLAALISWRWGINLDGLMGTAVAIFVLISGVGLVRDTIAPLLGSAPDPELVNRIEEKIMSYEGVLGTHDLMVHDYGPGHFFASVHVEVPAERNVLECHELIDLIELEMERDMGLQMVIHYDPIVTSDQAVGEIREFLSRTAAEMDSRMTIHDLRIVPGENNTNVIFDVVIPRGIEKSDQEILQELESRLAQAYPGHSAVIKIDRSFVAMS